MNGLVLRERLAAKQPVLLATLNFPKPSLAEYLAWLGFHVLPIDGEHGALNDDVVEDVARAAGAHGAATLVRLNFDGPAIERYVAVGATGVHVPMIENAKGAADVVDRVKFSPLGQRGVGTFRATRYAERGPWSQDLKDDLNAETVVALALESPAGCLAAGEIALTEGVDIVIIGESDLANALGHPGEKKHPEVRALSEAASDAIIAAGKTFAIAAHSRAEIEDACSRGAGLLITSVVGLLRNGSRAFQDAVNAAQ
jgi:2-keto-3-deoxy-L-rhamnonate aldolase RhmA